MGNSLPAICGDDLDSVELELEDLTQDEISMVIDTWKIPATKLIDSGETILYRFLDRHPMSQEKFQAFKNTPLLSLKGAPGFRTHALRIMNIFNSSVDLLDKENGLDTIALQWMEIGKDHIKRRVTKLEFIQIRDVILDVLTDLCQLTEDEQRAWNKLLTNICHFIFKGLENDE